MAARAPPRDPTLASHGLNVRCKKTYRATQRTNLISFLSVPLNNISAQCGSGNRSPPSVPRRSPPQPRQSEAAQRSRRSHRPQAQWAAGTARGCQTPSSGEYYLRSVEDNQWTAFGPRSDLELGSRWDDTPQGWARHSCKKFYLNRRSNRVPSFSPPARCWRAMARRRGTTRPKATARLQQLCIRSHAVWQSAVPQ